MKLSSDLSSSIASNLSAAGMSSSEVNAKIELFGRAWSSLEARSSAVRMWWIPGRIEFLGKHTDYAGGRSLLCAVERGFAFVAVPRDDNRVSIRDACRREHIDGVLSEHSTIEPGHWSTYPLTVCRRVAKNFRGPLRGIDIAFASDLPPAAGLSSSSALITATFLALSDVNHLAG